MKVHAYYIEDNASNNILLTFAGDWVCISDVFDGMPINRNNIKTIANYLTENLIDLTTFRDLYNLSSSNHGTGFGVILAQADYWREIWREP